MLTKPKITDQNLNIKFQTKIINSCDLQKFQGLIHAQLLRSRINQNNHNTISGRGRHHPKTPTIAINKYNGNRVYQLV